VALPYLPRAEESARLHKEQAMSSPRKRRKAVQAAIRRNNSWNWSFDKFVRAVVTATNKMSKAMEEAYAKSRAQHDHAG
jgi:hypothetical protein